MAKRRKIIDKEQEIEEKVEIDVEKDYIEEEQSKLNDLPIAKKLDLPNRKIY